MSALKKSFLEKTKSHKLVFLGDSAVGKSCIVARFIRGEFTDFQEPTIGAAFNTANIDLGEYEVRFEIWDTAGQERYRSLAPMYYRGAQVAVIVYDITQPESFTGAKNWIEEIKRKGNPDCIIALLGNKIDLDKHRKVTQKEVDSYANLNEIINLNVSAKTGFNIENAFKIFAKKIPFEKNKLVNNSELVCKVSPKKKYFCNLI